MVPNTRRVSSFLVFFGTNRRLRNEQEGGGDRTRTTTDLSIYRKVLHYYILELKL